MLLTKSVIGRLAYYFMYFGTFGFITDDSNKLYLYYLISDQFIKRWDMLHYHDMTNGVMAGSYRTGLGCTNVMQVNPYDGFVALGHSLGTVSMWKPTTCAMAFHPNNGHSCQKGLLAYADGSRAVVPNDLSRTQSFEKKTYMTHKMVKGYPIGNVLFRPYEDVLGIGHSMGWSRILIPGSDEPNFDSWVANPFENREQRSERRVLSLLRKKRIPTKQEKESNIEAANGSVSKKKTKGRNKLGKRATKKKEMIANAKRPFLEQQMKEGRTSG
ncbi:U3 small nucleolar RNA-associated protein 7 [Pyrus ussuriensis x Pyrus communis]|uniref:U3 small nucleolar RNA-associated protein 7 n=1 Tax=Pyrus ussuriensis x Pyrus communis TaxID=2448454 RepID=A0A5N5HQ10_9ROSA|nr:U3 small nucleolar RNA-associated protein 7 [Pyrus ussuriensis x Pyrus communis]